MQTTMKWIKSSPERAEFVIEEISNGSTPQISFYVLLLTSALIASFGLLADSTAVVIGAMLVSPLMTPIMGIALALVRGDSKLLGRAILAEALGVALAIGVSALFGLLPLAIKATPEMLARTHPNLLDLLVAVLAGFAGAVAMIDERISPALPGVAIATAIVPPLSNTGLCLALGAYQGASGSFLLFVANFFSILLVTSIVFYSAGLARVLRTPRWAFTRRFGWVVLGFLVVTVVLTNSLLGIIRARIVAESINQTLISELAKLPNLYLLNEEHRVADKKLNVLATVRGPRTITPFETAKIEKALSNKVNMKTELVIRNVFSKDVTSPGSTITDASVNLNGLQMTIEKQTKEYKIRNAEQVLWEFLSEHPGFALLEVKYLQIPEGNVILASIEGVRRPTQEELGQMEHEIRKRLSDPTIELEVKLLKAQLLNKYSQSLYGWSFIEKPIGEIEKLIPPINVAIKEALHQFPELYFLDSSYRWVGDRLEVIVETVGPRALTSEEVARMEKEVVQETGQHISLNVWTRLEVVSSPQGYTSVQRMVDKTLEETEKRILKLRD